MSGDGVGPGGFGGTEPRADAGADAGGVPAAPGADGAMPSQDDAGAPPLVLPACDGVSCGAGTCAMTEDGPSCACPPRWMGASCETCAREYQGPSCERCADGYVALADGDCVVDPCAEGVCQHGGQCSVGREGGAQCACAPQFTGTSCESCAPGHTGPACTDCLDGYTREGGLCKPFVCANYDCGDHGWCVVKDENPVCACKTGYTGAKCEACSTGYRPVSGACVLTLPAVQAPLTIWFDAADRRTLKLEDSGDVSSWRTKASEPNRPSAFFNKPDGRLPRYSAETRGVVFDGDILGTLAYNAPATHVTTFMVLRWNAGAGAQTIWRHLAYVEGSPLRERIHVQGSRAVYTHQSSTMGPVDVVEGDFYASAKPVRLLVTKRAPFLNGTAHTISDGKQSKTVPAQAGPITDPLYSYMGASRYLPIHERESLHGTLHEIVRYAGTLSKAEEQAVIDYLTVKWGL